MAARAAPRERMGGGGARRHVAGVPRTVEELPLRLIEVRVGSAHMSRAAGSTETRWRLSGAARPAPPRRRHSRREKPDAAQCSVERGGRGGGSPRVGPLRLGAHRRLEPRPGQAHAVAVDAALGGRQDPDSLPCMVTITRPDHQAGAGVARCGAGAARAWRTSLWRRSTGSPSAQPARGASSRAGPQAASGKISSAVTIH